MKETTVNKLPYPEDTDAPDGAAQIKALVDLLDTLKWGSRNLKPTLGLIQATTGATALESNFADVPGAVLEITPDVASNLAIVTFADLEETGPTSTTTIARPYSTIKLDAEADHSRWGTIQSGIIGNGTNITPFVRGTAVQGYVLALSAAKHTIKLRAKRSGASGNVNGAGSGFLYLLAAS